MFPWGVVCALTLALATGCGGPRAALRTDNAQLKMKVAQLRAVARTDRGKMRDLENQNFLLKDKLETAELERDRTGDAVPVLPVEVLEPDVAGDAGATDDYKVVGVDDHGYEIVYVGEAAKDRSVAPPLGNYANQAQGGGAPFSRPRVSPPARPLDGSDRIPAAGRRVPTIDRQMRKAPVASRSRSVEVDGARAMYSRTYTALKAGQHARAIQGFREFIAEYPDHGYADNAQYWLGEAFYDLKKYDDALREFRTVVSRYPRGNKVSDALLKVGFCYVALGRKDAARKALRQVVQIYPKGRPAEIAARRLRELE